MTPIEACAGFTNMTWDAMSSSQYDTGANRGHQIVNSESTRRFENTGLVPLHIEDMQVLSD